MALEGGRPGSKRHEQHHPAPQPQQRAGLGGDLEMGGHARRVSLLDSGAADHLGPLALCFALT